MQLVRITTWCPHCKDMSYRVRINTGRSTWMFRCLNCYRVFKSTLVQKGSKL